MDSVRLARDIVDILFLDTLPNDPLWNAARQDYLNGKWEEGSRWMRLRHESIRAGDIEDVSVSTVERGEAAYYVYLGAYYLAKADLDNAQYNYQLAVRSLRGYRYDHVGLAAHAGLGLAHKHRNPVSGRPLALEHLGYATRVARYLCQKASFSASREQQLRHERIVGWLGSLVAELQDTFMPRLIPVLRATAGELHYVPGDDFPYETGCLALDDHAYRLLDYRNRQEFNYRIKPLKEYFYVPVEGNSMLGEPKAQIRDGDTLLAWASDDWLAAGSNPAVIQQTDTLPRVKFVKIEERHLTLISANPSYAPCIYSARSPALRMLGVVEAIMEEA